MIHPNRFDGRVAVVTGGAGAFGTAIASQLAAEAARVVVADLDLDAASRVAATLGGDAIACRLDVTQPDSVVEAIAVAEQQFGGLDLLVNNAGLTHRITPLDELPDEAFDLVFDVNVKGTFLCSKHAIGAVATTRRRGDRQHLVRRSHRAPVRQRRVQRLQGRRRGVHSQPRRRAGTDHPRATR